MFSRQLLSRFSLLQKIFLAFAFAIALLQMATDEVHAETIIVTDTVETRFTDWVDVLTIPGFAAEQGTLLSVDITFEGFLHGMVSYENTGVSPATITATHEITVAIETLEGVLLSTLPKNKRVERVAAFDGISDGGGASGRTFVLTATQNISRTYTDPLSLGLFITKDPLNFQVTATGNSLLSGPGNFDALLRAQAASALLIVRYVYLPPIIRKSPAFQFKKFTNGYDADQPNDLDVPVLVPGMPVTWTYLLTNTGNVSFTLHEITVIDDQVGVTPQFDPTSDDGDQMLAPGEHWRFYATAVVQNLMSNPLYVTTVEGCRFVTNGESLPTYRNIGTVQIGALQATDASHYCNISPTNLAEEWQQAQQKIFLPTIWQQRRTQ